MFFSFTYQGSMARSTLLITIAIFILQDNALCIPLSIPNAEIDAPLPPSMMLSKVLQLQKLLSGIQI